MSQHLSRRAVVLRPFQRQCLLRPHTSVRHISNRDREPNVDFEAPDTLREKAQTQDPKQLERSDFGLLPARFRYLHPRLVRNPTAPPTTPLPAVPSRFKQALADRWKYEKKWLVTRFRDIFAMWNYYFIRGFIPGFWRADKPKGVFWHPRTRARADELYEKVYHAFSSKDTTHLKDICTEGLITNIHSRISGRPKGVQMTWKLTARDRWPYTRVVSNRFTYLPLPGADETHRPSAVRQLVLRKSTRQTLTIERSRDVYASSGASRKQGKRRLAWRPDGVLEEEAVKKEVEVDEEKDGARSEKYDKKVVEYLVLQKVMLHGEEKEWRLWGFTEPTTLESLEAAERKEDELAALQNKESALGA